MAKVMAYVGVWWKVRECLRETVRSELVAAVDVAGRVGTSQALSAMLGDGVGSAA